MGVKVAWGIAKALAIVALLPLLVIGLACVGSCYLVIPLAIIMWIGILVRKLSTSLVSDREDFGIGGEQLWKL